MIASRKKKKKKRKKEKKMKISVQVIYSGNHKLFLEKSMYLNLIIKNI